MSLYVANLAGQADTMLEAAHTPGVSADDRLACITEASVQLGDLVFDALSSKSPSHHAIRGAMVLACQPSIETIARGERHNTETANVVSANLLALSAHIVGERLLSTPSNVVLGACSELAVFSVGWWGMKAGRVPEDSYILPATCAKDKSTPGQRRNGTDMVLRLGGKRPKREPIQVKSSVQDSANSYDPDITVVNPGDLLRSKKKRSSARYTQALLSHVSYDRTDELAYAHAQLMIKIYEKRE